MNAGPIIELNFRRPLTFRMKDNIFPGELLIPDITFDSETGNWRCRWSITLIKSDLGKGVQGKDPLEALSRVLQLASELIKNSGYPDLLIWWQF